MLYRLFKYIIPPFAFRVFFRRIFYSNLKKVPLEKPLIFVGNHQNSFMDGILIGSYLPQPINFTMRADMFKKPLARFCLREFNVSPIYRLEEGFENVHKNLESFSGIYEVLSRNGNFIMFSEGLCVQEKRLQKLRKGTARLAFGAEEKFDLDVNIVPVGINYTYPAQFRKEVMINFHDPFSIKELKEAYREQPAKALLLFNEKCNERLKQEVIIIEDPKNDMLAEKLLVMGRNNMVLPFFRWRFDTDDRRLMEKNVAEKINTLSRSFPEELEVLKEKVFSYSQKLSEHRLNDENFARKLDFALLRYFAVIAGFPIFLAGYLSNLLPFLLPKFICNKLIKDLRFYSSVYVSSGTVLYLIYFPLLLLLGALLGGWPAFLLVFLVPLAGYFVLYYQEIFRERRSALRFAINSATNKPLIYDLTALRKEIQCILNNVLIS